MIDLIPTMFPIILIGHLIGDYLFQNNWMALNKKDHLLPVVVHACIYIIPICALLAFMPQVTWAGLGYYVALNAFLHGWLDHSDMIEPPVEANKEKAELMKRAAVAYTALVQTVADNTIHLITMVATLRLLTL